MCSRHVAPNAHIYLLVWDLAIPFAATAICYHSDYARPFLWTHSMLLHWRHAQHNGNLNVMCIPFLSQEVHLQQL